MSCPAIRHTARVALAELSIAAELIPNPAILINTIPILEARASSEIENIVTTTDLLFRFATDESSSPDPPTCSHPCAEDLRPGTRGCRLRTTVLSDFNYRQRRYRETADGLRVFGKARHDRSCNACSRRTEKLFVHRPLLDLLVSDTHEANPYVAHTTRDEPTTIEPAADVLERRLDVNRSQSLDEQLRLAIANRLLIQVDYGGSTRVVEPHDYGIQRGTKRLLAYQRRRSGGPPGKAVSGWRLLDIAKISNCVVLEETFRGSRGRSHQQHYAWDFLFARVA